MDTGVRWTVRDRQGNDIYLTEERWQHIISPENRPEMAEYEDELMATIRTGRRKRDEVNPRKFRYVAEFKGLPEDNTHMIAIVLFRIREGKSGEFKPNNYIVTGYLKELWWKS